MLKIKGDITLKSIAVITDSHSSLAAFIKRNLEEIYSGYVTINNYYLNSLKEDEIIEDNLTLIMIKERVLKVKKHVKNIKDIVVLNRTIKEKEVYKIFSIPEGMDVLVVNDNIETTMQTLTLFYELGINHLNLIPYEKDKEYKNVKIALTPGESKYVPDYIEEIIDVGDRCIDISTFIKITSMLNIDNKEISKRLINYSDEIISLDNGIKNKYKELFIKNEEMDAIINLSTEGILLASIEGEIILYNKSFVRMFDISEDITNFNIDKIFHGDMKKIIVPSKIENEVIKYKNKYLNVNKCDVIHFGQKTGVYFNIQEITYIRQLEQNLSKKLREKGQVSRYTFEDIITNSPKMLECIKLAKKISNSDLTVLITGESGTGKELLAQSMHNGSKRHNQPFVAINCAAMPENLLESELFGYEEGAFTGALKEGKAGLFEQAHNGTIFLDEIGDMPLHLQTKLLRILQERQVMRIGSQKIVDIDVRVIAATNKNLLDMMQKGEFRTDLYYRLNVLPINIPSLKERKDDILPLIIHFMGKNAVLAEKVKNIFLSYKWPGNIRELRNIAEYLSLMCESLEVNVTDLPFYLLDVNDTFESKVEILEGKCSLLKAIDIMNIIKKYNESNSSLGRTNIVRIFQENKMFITEGEVRKILATLNELELITSSIGRKGSQITDKGLKFLNRLENRLTT